MGFFSSCCISTHSGWKNVLWGCKIHIPKLNYIMVENVFFGVLWNFKLCKKHFVIKGGWTPPSCCICKHNGWKCVLLDITKCKYIPYFIKPLFYFIQQTYLADKWLPYLQRHSNCRPTSISICLTNSSFENFFHIQYKNIEFIYIFFSDYYTYFLYSFCYLQ